MSQSRDEILATARCADHEVWHEHIRGFVAAFVEEAMRDHWLGLLLEPSKNTRRSPRQMFNSLDRRKCSDLTSPWSINPDVVGVYDDFSNEPRLLSFEHSLVVGEMREAVFSICAGEMALFFSHEGEILLCQEST